MTENEAIERLNCLLTSDGDFTCGEVVQAAELAVSALKEVKQYRAIGTVDECREAIEKKIPMNPINPREHQWYWDCPICNGRITPTNYCCHCGQKMDWEWRQKNRGKQANVYNENRGQ